MPPSQEVHPRAMLVLIQISPDLRVEKVFSFVAVKEHHEFPVLPVAFEST